MVPAILGLGGQVLSDDERSFFSEVVPAGFVLFARNCQDRDQLRALTDSLREVSERADVPILIDQEGGRVARMKPPEWPPFPAGWRFAELYAKAPISAIEAARVNAQAIATLLGEVGINTDCLPVLDIRRESTHDVIGDRALGDEPIQVAALGRAVLEGLEAGGVCGVVKHVPGHGRAASDSHTELPVVDADAESLALDLAPFHALRDAPMAMTAHVLYRAWDSERPASISPVVIREVIRGQIGFNGLLMSDDIAMEALSGSHAERAKAAVDAGCDVALHCSGRFEDNVAVAEALGDMGDTGLERLRRAMGGITGKASAQGYDVLAEKRDALLSYA
jgi:beta-N-acetylhexosaminidase